MALRSASWAAVEMEAAVSPVVEVAEATKLFKGKRALDRVSCTILPGQFVAIVGKSGAGKTTLLRCLSRAITLTSGAIRFGHEDVGPMRGKALRRHRARVGMIYQQFNLVRRLRVLDNVLVGRLPRLDARQRWMALARHF